MHEHAHACEQAQTRENNDKHSNVSCLCFDIHGLQRIEAVHEIYFPLLVTQSTDGKSIIKLKDKVTI